MSCLLLLLTASLLYVFHYTVSLWFMQDQGNSSQARKSWYQKAMGMRLLWKASKPTEMTTTSTTLSRTVSNKSSQISNSNSNRHKIRKLTSVKVETSFTRVCLCVPISSFTEAFQADVHPRRSSSYPRTKPLITPPASKGQVRIPNARNSVEGRRFFRGKSLTHDVLMRRFVIEEEAMWQVRRRNQMEAIWKRNVMKRRKLGTSPLSRMVLAEEECAQV